MRYADEWDDPAYDLDFIQLHLYVDVRHPRRDRTLIGHRASALGVSKPVVIGEFPANGDAQHPPEARPPPWSMTDYLVFADEGGYVGAWPWSFKGVDGFGGVDTEKMREALSGGR